MQDCIPGNSEVSSLKDYIKNQYIKKRPGICKKLWNMIHQSLRQPSNAKIIEYIPQAISRAKIIGECHPNDPDYPENQIGTEVYKLLEKLTQMSMNLES